MARKEHHVVPNNAQGGWDVKINGAGRRTFHTRKKSTAVRKARAISRRHGSELVVHDSKGRIEVKNSHPTPTKRRKKAKPTKRVVKKTKRPAKMAKRPTNKKVKRVVKKNKRPIKKVKRVVKKTKRPAKKAKRVTRKVKRKNRRR